MSTRRDTGSGELRDLYAVVMAGGSGARFWPASTPARPKQFLPIGGARPLIVETLARLDPLFGRGDLSRRLVVAGEAHAAPLRALCPDLPAENLLLEPCARNTAPCLALAALHILARDPEGVMSVWPADHHIGDLDAFTRAALVAVEGARAGKLVTFGLRPTRPETGYGYIELDAPAGFEEAVGARRPARRFVEKPAADLARQYLDSGRFLWNGGVFFFRAARLLEEVARQLPRLWALLAPLRDHIAEGGATLPTYPAALAAAFGAAPSVSVDYGVMEGAEGVEVVPVEMGWSDVGQWAALREVYPLDAQGNALVGADHVAVDARECVVYCDEPVSLLGVRGVVVARGEGGLLVCDAARSQDVRLVAARRAAPAAPALPPPPAELLARVFRENDIRGVAGEELTEELSFALGLALGDLLWAETGAPAGAPPWVAVGRDARHSGPALAAALIAGLRAAGVGALDLGLAPTPLVYYALHAPPAALGAAWGRLAGAVAVTGSHNPPRWNGFKVCVGREALHGEGLRALRDAVAALSPARLGAARASASGAPALGAYERLDLTPSYVAQVAPTLSFGPRRLRVVVDAGSGALGPAALALYARLPVDVVPLYCEPDGDFPFHHPDPTVEKNLADLKERVRAEGADLGLAFDGDGDRLGVVDALGRPVWGDQLMVFFARDVLAARPGARVIGEVKCSQSLYDAIEEAGGVPEMWRVGHSLIKARMRETGAPLAGEMSGHIFFADRFFGYDDAAYVGARLLELLSRAPAAPAAAASLRGWVDALPPSFTTPELRVSCPDAHKAAVVARFSADFGARYPVVAIDGARVRFEEGWGLLRASNTQPVLVLRFEARSEALLAGYRAEVEGWLRAHAPEVDLDADEDS